MVEMSRERSTCNIWPGKEQHFPAWTQAQLCTHVDTPTGTQNANAALYLIWLFLVILELVHQIENHYHNVVFLFSNKFVAYFIMTVWFIRSHIWEKCIFLNNNFNFTQLKRLWISCMPEMEIMIQIGAMEEK